MNEVDTIALSERVKRLERQNKLIKLTGIVVILGMAFMLLVGAKEKVPKEIVAEEFCLVDTQGRTRALLSVLGGSRLSLWDERGEIRALLSVYPTGPSLYLYDEKRESRAILSVLPEGSALYLYDKNGKLEFSAP